MDADRSSGDHRSSGTFLEAQLEDRGAHPWCPRAHDAARSPEQPAESTGLVDPSTLPGPADHQLARADLLRGRNTCSGQRHDHRCRQLHHDETTPAPVEGFPPSAASSTVRPRHAPPKVRAEAMEPQDFLASPGAFSRSRRKKVSELETRHYLANGSKTAPAAKEAIAWAGETQAQMVDLKFCDLLGTWQHMTLPVSAFDESAFDDGLGFDGSSIRGWQGISESDMLLMPDASSAILDPFTEA